MCAAAALAHCSHFHSACWCPWTGALHSHREPFQEWVHGCRTHGAAPFAAEERQAGSNSSHCPAAHAKQATGGGSMPAGSHMLHCRAATHKKPCGDKTNCPHASCRQASGAVAGRQCLYGKTCRKPQITVTEHTGVLPALSAGACVLHTCKRSSTRRSLT